MKSQTQDKTKPSKAATPASGKASKRGKLADLHLEFRGNEVVWVKSDGNATQRVVSRREELDFRGFPTPSAGSHRSLSLIAGDPRVDEILLVQTNEFPRSSRYLISKSKGECEKIRYDELDWAKQVVSEQPANAESIYELREKEQARKCAEVDVEALADERALSVWISDRFDGYWTKSHGEFSDLPEGWCLLESGDGALTTRVRKGSHWIALQRRSVGGRKISEVIGTFAPSRAIQEAFEALGGKEGALRRNRGKQQGQSKREELLTRELHSAICERYPLMPKQDVKEVMETCRSERAVGRASWLYIRKKDSVALQNAAEFAVRAHVRHKHTDYDGILGTMALEHDARTTARRSVAQRIDGVLHSWVQETTVQDKDVNGC